MCGIIGAISYGNVAQILLNGLKQLEYRGYDSSGIAVIHKGSLQRVRRIGYVSELERAALEQKIQGNIGIGHTRWATHGGVTEENAHPHTSGDIAVVHNGVIENHHDFRKYLTEQGYNFTSDTDTEVIAHLLHLYCSQGADLASAVRRVVGELRGAFAIVAMSATQPQTLVCARMGCPLVLGFGVNDRFVASDACALATVTKQIAVLHDGDIAVLTPASVEITDAANQPVQRPFRQSTVSAAALDLGAHQHFMQKEIHEQPTAIAQTARRVIEEGRFLPSLFGAEAEAVFRKVEGVLIVACGSSYYAGSVARHWIEQIARLPCNVEIASEYRYRDAYAHPNYIVVAVSQSGETLDTLEALKHAKASGHIASLAVCNVRDSAIPLECQLAGYTAAGVEIGVASTKAFTAQLVVLFQLAVVLGVMRGAVSEAQEALYVEQLRQLPQLAGQALALEPQIRTWAVEIAPKQHALFLGRGLLSPVAMEGALKLKEIAYVHAEACPAGELKHGPLALVDAELPVVVLVPDNHLRDKVKANVSEVQARGGVMYLLAEEGCDLSGLDDAKLKVIETPKFDSPLAPVVTSIPLQLLAYHAALARGNNVDRPRNLSKTVTVE